MSKRRKRSAAAAKKANGPSDAADEALEENDAQPSGSLVSRHLQFGWWALLAFISLGFVLEALWAFRVPWFLVNPDGTRRLMWRLAHAHGTMFSLLNIAFGLTVSVLQLESDRLRRMASPCLLAATLTLPVGFFLGGLFTYSGEPGLGVLLVPVGGLLLVIAVVVTCLSARS